MNRAVYCCCLVLVLFARAGRADEVDDFILEKMSRQHIPGLSLAVLKNAKPVKVKGYGSSNLELGTPATPQTVYKIGSVSKQFIAAGIVLLNQEGKVGYDDSVRKYFADAPEAWQPVTLRHLLTHTGGLVRESPAFDFLKPQSDAELIKAAYSTPLVFQPGEKYQYCNLGYFMLAEIITRVSGKPWPDYLHEKVFVPLGMSATRTTTHEILIPNSASSYLWSGGTYQNAAFMLGVRPSGAFISTVLDLAKWDAALYMDKPFSAQQREIMWASVKLNDGSDSNYGFGWQIDRVGSHRQIRHRGTITAFRSEVSRFVDDQLTVVVLTNSASALPDGIALRVASFYIPDLLPRRKAMKLDARTLDGYTGRYLMAEGRERTVTRRKDKLAVAAGSGKESIEIGVLRPETATRFFDEDDSRSTFIFAADEQGKRQLVEEDEQGREVRRFTRADLD
jgi:D-alanyl-D-alanine carboxypeptidase